MHQCLNSDLGYAGKPESPFALYLSLYNFIRELWQNPLIIVGWDILFHHKLSRCLDNS